MTKLEICNSLVEECCPGTDKFLALNEAQQIANRVRELTKLEHKDAKLVSGQQPTIVLIMLDKTQVGGYWNPFQGRILIDCTHFLVLT